MNVYIPFNKFVNCKANNGDTNLNAMTRTVHLQVQFDLPLHSDRVNAVSISPDGRMLVSAGKPLHEIGSVLQRTVLKTLGADSGQGTMGSCASWTLWIRRVAEFLPRTGATNAPPRHAPSQSFMRLPSCAKLRDEAGRSEERRIAA